ncbi:plasmid partition protein [Streptomyces sp. LHD-70]|uniref:plasmid partition protein n=1 Tax=Streptomyces sp. LHD-70 TaxID=3072140 RepID=UPI00281003D8|nr:plasmid partition protein [Streptomyces sp. LHD-70]MDQ8704886.1 plasmid partition protein [Streptomyces sp. LHD-70]
MLIASLKPRTMGGTTNTGLLAYALHRAGRPVAVYDADESQQLAAWARDAGDFPCQVVPAATAFFADTIYPAMDPERINLVDVGHAENHPEIVDSVLEVADVALVTVSPTQPDYQRLMRPEKGTPLAKMVKRSASLRDTGAPPTTVVLLNRCQAGAKSTGDYKSKLRADGWDVLTSTIPRREAIASALGFPCDKPERRAPYDQLVTELADRGLLK